MFFLPIITFKKIVKKYNTYFYHSVIIDEYISWFKISMNNKILVQIFHSFQELPHNVLYGFLVDGPIAVALEHTLRGVVTF